MATENLLCLAQAKPLCPSNLGWYAACRSIKPTEVPCHVL